MLNDDIPPSLFARNGSVKWWAVRVLTILEGRNNNFVSETWLAILTLD